MPKLTIQALGKKLLDKRGGRGIREVAKEIGVSPATLSRVERGHLPDIRTFEKICDWLKVNPGDVLGVASTATSRPKIAVHFKKPQTIAPKTAQALAQMILAAHRAWLASE